MPLPGQEAPIVDVPVTEVVDINKTTASNIYNNETKVKVLNHVTGDNWKINYYSQYLKGNDAVSTEQDIQDPSLKQYEKVESLILKVTSELSMTTDTESNVSTLTGEANLVPIVTPNIGDAFVADIGDGAYGLFNVTSYERQSHFKDTVWVITYTLIEHITAENLTELDSKVVNVLVYDPDTLYSGNGPVFTKPKHDQLIESKKVIRNLLDEYYCQFYYQEQATLIYKHEDSFIYDPFIVEFFNNHFTSKEMLDGKMPTVYPAATATFNTSFRTILDAFANRSPGMLKRVVKTMQTTPTTSLRNDFMFSKLTFSNISNVLQPREVNNLEITTGFEPRDYIVTEAVYGEGTLEGFDKLVVDFINGNNPTYEQVMEEVNTRDAMGQEMLFQRIPLLIILLKYVQ